MKLLLFWNAIFLCSLAAQPGLRLQGEIDPPVEGLSIEVYCEYGQMLAGRAYTAHDGRFEVAGLEAGQYQVRLVNSSGDTIRVELVSLYQSSAPILIRLPQRKRERPPSGLISVRDLSRERSKGFKQALPHHALAISHMEAGRLSEARNELLKAIELDPHQVIAYTNLSIVDIRLGDVVGAEQSALHARELDGSSIKANYLVGLTRWMQGKGPKPDVPAGMATR